mmetsp:Transcript_68195/g.162792  ORF Transcript_68195/g.162792 Transcript_68195/m.162792 type:complete len:372 (+) Transcript_68195:1637-2752(+)
MRRMRSSSVSRPSATAVRRRGSIVSRPGKPGAGVAEVFSSTVWGAWCDEKTSMMSMLSHSACWSFFVASFGRTSVNPLPMLSSSWSQRKRWCGETPHVTLAPRRLASRTTMISSRRESAHTWIARSYIIAIISTAASVLLSERTRIGMSAGVESKCAIHTVRSSICSEEDVAWSSSIESASTPLSVLTLAELLMVAPTRIPKSQRDLFCAAARAVSMLASSTTAGLVLGIAQIIVTPPASAAAEHDAQSSLWVSPGSRTWTCMSMRPGMWIVWCAVRQSMDDRTPGEIPYLKIASTKSLAHLMSVISGIECCIAIVRVRYPCELNVAGRRYLELAGMLITRPYLASLSDSCDAPSLSTGRSIGMMLMPCSA